MPQVAREWFVWYTPNPNPNPNPNTKRPICLKKWKGRAKAWANARDLNYTLPNKPSSVYRFPIENEKKSIWRSWRESKVCEAAVFMHFFIIWELNTKPTWFRLTHTHTHTSATQLSLSSSSSSRASNDQCLLLLLIGTRFKPFLLMIVPLLPFLSRLMCSIYLISDEQFRMRWLSSENS